MALQQIASLAPMPTNSGAIRIANDLASTTIAVSGSLTSAGTVSTVTTVSTVSSVTNLAQIGGRGADNTAMDFMQIAADGLMAGLVVA